VTAARINWRPKSENLRELAEELNLGLDAFVFLDDDPAVRLEVEANAPGVTVVPLPRDPALYGPTLARLWCFDAAATTSEDRGRAHMMQQERERRNGREAASDLATYLQSLRLRGRMRPAQERDLPRVAQLTQKTNQFNLSLRRRGVADLKALGPRYAVHVIEASDRFGDYGLIGVCILAGAEDGSGVYELDTFLMSCRALGRGLEDAALHEMLGVVRAGGGRRLHAPFVAGPRNQPVRAFLERNGFRAQGESLVIETAARNALPEHIAWEGPEATPLRVGA
jgi:FkbH-like protein